MKTIKKYIVSALLLLSVVSAFSQEEISSEQKNVDLKIVNEIFLNSYSLPTNSLYSDYLSLQKTNEKNFVTVTQMGSYNSSDVFVKSSNARINVFQNGTNNIADIDKSALQINQTVIQNGDNNYLKDYTPYRNQNISQQFFQNGDNLKLYNYGSNSISDQMNIFQTGNQKTIIILNH